PTDIGRLSEDAGLRAAIGEAVERVNRSLSTIERVRRFLLLPEPFSVANGMMTPTLKVRRHAVKATYGPEVEALFRR
ncbi:MAG TPA: long-chain fatty acid--CoA ligase, partial [Kiloniellales bacterium]|nr:long-chain fatty acid--CoA ligase [Kiloniellales bacterium]